MEGDGLSVNKRFGLRITQLRKQRNLSQEALALKSSLNRTYMGCIERGEKSPSLETINKIANALEISLTSLFDYE